MKNKNNLGFFIVIGLVILGYISLKVAQKYSFNKEYESGYNGIIIKQKPGSRGFTDLYLSNKSCIHLAFYSDWERQEIFVGDSISKDHNSREIRVYKKDNKSGSYQYFKSMDMIID
ncbi:hypothetical protein BN1195_00245 [Chryseobacterium oranimense G311]|uniref:hypothetical protein n=1 Tax=Chryseobacterium oranimense TaxID=421058 RepID=UPI000533BA19|nr:hypothetical protein [Chryseobacterium oranimense]CEJ67963.1 hypothetical protein BN1195_00245 [Chryseobacterium oranimense G311]